MGHEYSFTQESDDDNGSWPISTQMYSADSLHIQVNGSAPLHPQMSLPIYNEQWNSYANCVSPNDATQTSPNYAMMSNYSPGGSNSLSPFSLQTPSSLPQLSPTNSDPSMSPLYGSSRLGTPTTPASTQSFMPSPTLSQEDHLLQHDSQVLTSDVCHSYLVICFY